MSNTKTGPLSGVRILDFTWAAAGPQGTLLAGFLDAEVLKVESVRRLDLMRRGMSTLYEGFDNSPHLNDFNFNKLGVRLDLSKPEGRELALSLVSVCDAVVDNFRPGVLERLGLGYGVMRRANPSIVVLAAANGGSTGPESRFAGYAGIFNALGGMGYLTGYQDGPPTMLRDSVDLRVGSALAFAIVAALYHRRQTGQGQFVDMASREVVSCLVGDHILEYTMNGHNPMRQGNRDAVMAPHNVYRCRENDTWVSIAVGTEDEWRALCRVMSSAELASDPRFADAYARKKNEAELDKLITQWTKQRTPQEATLLLQKASVAAAPSMSMDDLLADEHLQARGAYVTVQHPVLGKQTNVGVPWKFSRTPASIRRHGPLFGQDNPFVFGEILGMPKGDVERLTKTEVLS